ncbi:gliding motility protein, partial [Streptomyces sp. SID9944]|nr:gliding motility protein [Streptomyces sp. SID9944]
ADGAAGSDPEAAETGDGAAAPEAAADAGGDGVDIPKQQSAEEAAEQETGKGART